MPVVLAAIIAVAGSIGLLVMNATPPHDGRGDSIPTAIVAGEGGRAGASDRTRADGV